MPMRTRERDVLKAVMDVLAASHVFALRLNTGAFHIQGRYIASHSGGPGTSDVLAFPRARNGAVSVLWIECKSSTGKQSPEQLSFAEHVTRQGHFYLLARSSDDVLQWLTEHGARHC